MNKMEVFQIFFNILTFLLIVVCFALATNSINEVKNEVKAVKEILIQKEKSVDGAGDL